MIRDDSTDRTRHAAELHVSCSRCGALHRAASDVAFHPLCRACLEAGSAGVYALSAQSIADAVGETSPGSYALGYLDGTAFTVFYVGRSDSDVSGSLRTWVGAPSRPRHHRASFEAPWRARFGPPAGLGTHALALTTVGIDTGYTHFAFCYAPSAIAAFEQECRDYHELGGSENLDNPCHPEPPPDSPWACPMRDSVR